VGAVEAGLCAACWGSCSHCVHAFQAFRVADRFSREARDYERRIQRLERPFNQVVGDLDRMMDSIHVSQMVVFLGTATALKDGSSYGLSELKKINAPQSKEMPAEVGALNAAQFSCAIDGMPCPLPGKPANSSLASRAHVMTEVANASRPEWAANRGWSGVVPPTYLHPRFLADLTKNIQREGMTIPLVHNGTAKTVQQQGSAALHQGTSSRNSGQMSSAHEHGTLFTWWKHGIGAFGYDAEVVSNASGGLHSPRRGHTTRHDMYEGASTRELMVCSLRGNCFMKFRADPNPRHDFGQPHVYSYLTEKLRMGTVKAAPWQLNQAATVRFQQRNSRQATLRLAADEGAGLSKALVYYHRLGDWREPPNMFNPFWRAKLHPFTPQDAAVVLEAAGHPDGAELATVPRLPL